MGNKIALCMICKGDRDEPSNLKRALNSIYKYVDGIFITLTGARENLGEIEKVCQEFKVNISYKDDLWEADEKTVNWLKEYLGYEPYMKVGDKLFLFDEARNFNFSQVPKEYDWILWIDTDDVFRRGENLGKVTSLGRKLNIEAFYFNYLYQVEFEGEYCATCNQKVDPEKRKIKHVIIEHIRERLVRNNGKFKWIAPIHETLIEQVPTNKTDNYDCDVVHLATKKDREKSLTRNLKNLELAIARTEGKDPRHVYYLAKAYFDLHHPEYDKKAIPLIQSYLDGEHKSGWPQERAQAYEYLAELYRRRGEVNNAIKAGMNALIEAPDNSSIFINVAASYILKKEWERALFWIKTASVTPLLKSTLVKNPKDMEGMKYEIIFNACLNLGKIDEAWAAAVKMRELVPGDKIVEDNYNFISQLREQRDVTRAITRLAEYLKLTNERHKIKPLLAAVPQIAEQTPFIIDLKLKNNPPKYWKETEIAFYCGPGWTIWSPKRLENPKEAFIGGSEEAVIRMTKELQKIGWKITVYGDPGEDEGEYEGVKYLPYYKFNWQDNFNIVILWRQLGALDQNIKAKKIYFWAHDIQNPLEWTKERVDKLTKAFFLSKWHRDNVPNLSEEKVMITSNGI